MEKAQFDLTIIGGGAAGMMAAISARRKFPHFKILIIDRTFALGRKILVCGAGRCNVTNINLNKSTKDHYYGADADFTEAVFEQYTYQDIVDFFTDLGVELYVERKTSIGKLFPVTNQAKTVTALLEDELARNNIEVLLNTQCDSVTHDGQQFVCTITTSNSDSKEQRVIASEYLIISAGGKTYPALGSNGSGYDLAASLGHKIITPVPSALPLEAPNKLSHELQGSKVEVETVSEISGNKIKSSIDELMFTKYGLSGPAILNISREISIAINRNQNFDCYVILNFFPEKQLAEVVDFLQKRWQLRPSQTLEKSLFGLFPNKIATALIRMAGFDTEQEVSSLSSADINRFVHALQNYRVRVTNTRGWNEAEFTAGGVDTSEINIGTLESKICSKLFFAGEILDVDGDVGGFNLSWAWSSGFVAGQLKTK